MQHRHQNIAFELPDDWNDRSTLLYIGPDDQPPTALSISFVEAADVTPKQVLHEQARLYAQSDPSFEVHEESAFDEGWQMRQSMQTDNLNMQQVTIALRTGDTIVLATASCEASHYETSAEALSQILRSIRPV